MKLEFLSDLLPKPASPVDPGADMKGWVRVFERLGTRLPEDYVKFINAYGTGAINEFLWVYNPFSQNVHLNLQERIGPVLSGLRALKSEFPEQFPHPLYFEPGGLLPWGVTDNGDELFWETSELVDHWPVIVIGRHEYEAERHEMTMTRFLADGLAGRLTSLIFPDIAIPRFDPAP